MNNKTAEELLEELASLSWKAKNMTEEDIDRLEESLGVIIFYDQLDNRTYLSTNEEDGSIRIRQTVGDRRAEMLVAYKYKLELDK